ncbi:MAG: efflux RND transporter periplasmic adaptor subunit [Cellvibrionaceae bacterium]
MSSVSQQQAASSSWKQVAGLSHAFDYPAWLELQCGLIGSAYAGVLVVAEQKQFKPVAVWPEANSGIETLTDLIEQVLDDGEALVANLAAGDGSASSHFGVAYPVVSQNAVIAVIAVAVSVASESELSMVMHELQWGAAWVELRQTRELYTQREDAFERLSTSIDLLSRVLPESGFDNAALRLVTELAINLNSDLVSIGFLKGKGVELAHLSHSAEFSKHMNLVRSIENAMDESLDQRAPIVCPSQDGTPANLVTVAHRALNELQDAQTIMTVPLSVGDEWIGAITLQRDIDQPFTLDDVRYCESIAALAVSSLEEKRHNDRSLRLKIKEAGAEQVVRLTGPGFVGRKLILGTLALLIVLFSFLTGDYRLSADATLQTISQQVIVAPFEGYIKEVNVRAGDVVKKGDVLLTLDDRDLLLEQLKWRSQQNKLSRQYQEAIAGHDRSRITILDAQLAQAKAQLDLVSSQLQRSVRRAPFDGLVVSGDLSQRLGGTVSHGESLFEVSPVNAYRVKLLVKESRIADLQIAQAGVVYLSAIPDYPFAFNVDNITPVTEYQDSSTFFVVEGRLHNTHDRLRPGMEGVGKIVIDQRNLFGIWTRELVEWMRLGFWRWWG